MNDSIIPSLMAASGADSAAIHRAITPRVGVTELTPSQLDERAIVHYGTGAHAQFDAFRELRTRLMAISDDNFVALVVPVSAGCGGSFVARNLAFVTTLDGTKSALLVDCNLRNASQHRSMRIDPVRGGLMEYLDSPNMDVANVLYETGMARLRLLPAGHAREGSEDIEQFSSFRMRLLVDSLRSRYADRYIFLDGPPVLGAPDARILAGLADMVILVAGYGHDTPAAVMQAASNFDPAKFAGVVFNENA